MSELTGAPETTLTNNCVVMVLEVFLYILLKLSVNCKLILRADIFQKVKRLF